MGNRVKIYTSERKVPEFDEFLFIKYTNSVFRAAIIATFISR